MYGYNKTGICIPFAWVSLETPSNGEIAIRTFIGRICRFEIPPDCKVPLVVGIFTSIMVTDDQKASYLSYEDTNSDCKESAIGLSPCQLFC